MAEPIYNELETIWWTVAFYDRNSSAATPLTVSYGIYDGIDGSKLSTGTPTPATSVEITVPSTANAIRHNKQFERRVLSVTATFSTGQQPSQKTWLVKNLRMTQST